MRPVYSDAVETAIVKLTIDDGLVGWGEAKAPVAPRVCKTIVDELFAEALIGRDPFDAELLWETLYAAMRLRGHSAGFFIEPLSGVDIALWDLMGKAVGKPVHKLLGGAYRDRVQVYASGVPATRAQPGAPDWDRMLGAVRDVSRRGFRGLKVGIGLEPGADVRSVEAIRRAGGITELKRIAVLADAFGTGFTPHVSIGSAIHFAASLLVAAAVPNLLPMEYWYGANPLGDRILTAAALGVVDGCVAVPQGPGLRIDVDESRLLAQAAISRVTRSCPASSQGSSGAAAGQA